MFGSKKQRKATRVDTLIGKGTCIDGDVAFSGGLHVEGVIKGNVRAEEGAGALLTVSEQGRIQGEVEVPTIILDGTVEGDVHAAERVELASQARVNGNVYYNLIEMAIGAAVNGSLIHRAERAAPRLAYDSEPGGESSEEAMPGGHLGSYS